MTDELRKHPGYGGLIQAVYKAPTDSEGCNWKVGVVIGLKEGREVAALYQVINLAGERFNLP